MATILVVQPAAAYDRMACPVTEKRSTRRKSIATMSLLPVRWWSGWRNIFVFARNRSQQSFMRHSRPGTLCATGALLRALTPQRWPGLFLISSMVDARTGMVVPDRVCEEIARAPAPVSTIMQAWAHAAISVPFYRDLVPPDIQHIADVILSANSI